MNPEPKSKETNRHIVFLGSSLLLSALFCWFVWLLTHWVGESLRYVMAGQPIAVITDFCLGYAFLIPLLPLPWLAAAARFVIRGGASVHQLHAFSTTLILTLLCLFAFVAVALVVPWLPSDMRLHVPAANAPSQ